MTKHYKLRELDNPSNWYIWQGLREIRMIEDLFEKFKDINMIKTLFDDLTPADRRRIHTCYPHLMHNPVHATKGFMPEKERKVLMHNKSL